MDEVLGHRPATRPQVVIDTGASRPVTPVTPAASEIGAEGGDNEEEDQPTANESEPGSLNFSTQSLAGTQQSASRKRKRRSKSNSVMTEFLERVITAQAKSDERTSIFTRSGKEPQSHCYSTLHRYVLTYGCILSTQSSTQLLAKIREGCFTHMEIFNPVLVIKCPGGDLTPEVIRSVQYSVTVVYYNSKEQMA